MTTRTPQDYALEDCPFCGSKAHFEIDDQRWEWIECESCAMQGNRSASLMEDCKPKLAEAWNRRAPQSGWISVDERLPASEKPVLLDIGKKFPIRAMWVAKHTVEAGNDDPDWGEYDEANDMYYCPEGWYEWNEHEETHWRVSATPVRWTEIPLPPSTKGEPTASEEPDLWYLQDTRSYVGNDVLWWAKDGKGYTTDVSKAHVYSRGDAFRQAAMRGTDRAWPKAYIDGKTRPAVDMQYIKHAEAIATKGESTNG